jgi:LacI family transcriptional regulator
MPDILLPSSVVEARSSSRSRGVTLRDVAAQAGVSQMTASVVLNGAKPGMSVATGTRERILKAAEELKYRPNLAARSMRSGKSMRIGVLVRNNSRLDYGETLSHPLAYEMILGISEGLEEAGYMMSFVRLSDVDPEHHVQSSAFQGHYLDGLIVVSDVPAVSRERLESLLPHCVWLDSGVWKENGCVRRDEHHAGFTAVRSLSELGYRDIVYLDSPLNGHFSAAARLQGAKEAALQCDVELRIVEETEAVWSGLLDDLNPSTALLLSTGYQIYILQRHLAMCGKVAGRDFAVAACDAGFHGNGLEWPELASVNFDRFALGRAATRVMLQRLAEPEQSAPSLKVQGEWIPGATAPPR